MKRFVTTALVATALLFYWAEFESKEPRTAWTFAPGMVGDERQTVTRSDYSPYRTYRHAWPVLTREYPESAAENGGYQ